MTDSGNIILELTDVSVCYRSRRRLLNSNVNEQCVLKNLSLVVHRGESIGVLGRNGSGKSTMLKILGGLMLPDSGAVDIRTNSISLLSIQVGFAHYLSGRNNAILSGLMLGMKKRDVMDCLEDIKEMSGLGDYFEEKVECYSAGMRSRLGFSTAVKIDTEILLIDEILAVGDVDFKKKSLQVIMDKIQTDKTVVLVSHNPEHVRQCCTRAIWLDKGRVVMDGDVEEVIVAYEKN